MKEAMNIRIFCGIIVVCGFLCPLVSAKSTNFTSEKKLIEKLSAHTVEDIKGDIGRNEKKKPLKIDEIFDDVDGAVNFYRNNKLSKEGATQIQRVCLLTLLHDNTSYCIERTLRLYDRNKAIFKGNKNRFHPYDWKLISDLYEGFTRGPQD
jgi:hypothetical protein